MEYNHLRNSLNAGRVRRFHTAVEIPPQSVAEHSFGVALIVEYLHGLARPENLDRHAFAGRLMRHAIKHDLSEYFTADMPSPVRKEFDCEEFNDMADHYAREKLDYDPPEEGSVVADWIKAADKLEALRYFCQLVKEGNTVAKTYVVAQHEHILKERLGADAETLANEFVRECHGGDSGHVRVPNL